MLENFRDRQKIVFVISSIGGENTEIRKRASVLLTHLIRPALHELEYIVIRADEISSPNVITKDIVRLLEDSDLVIADVHDNNPNVLYELAIRNAVNKPFILIKDPEQKLPFDLQHIKAISVKQDGDVKLLENKKEQLRDFVRNAEKDKDSASESIVSNFLKLAKFKKNFPKYMISVGIAMAFLAIFPTFIGYSMLEENQSYLRAQQINTIELVVYEKIQNLIDHSNVYSMMFTNGYSIGDNSTEFIKNVIEEYRYIDLFTPNVMTGDILAYVYIMKPGPECEFLLYAYLPHMTRGDGRDLEACKMAEDTDLFLTSMYPTTGTKSFANALVKRIDLDRSQDNQYDLIIGSAIDWDRFSNDIQRSITLENTKFVLVDDEGFVVVDCDKNNCENIKAQALGEEGFSKDSVAKKYDPNEYNIYENHEEPILLNNNYLETYNIKNAELLEGWKIYMHYS